MTQSVAICVDPAESVVAAVIQSLKLCFDPNSVLCPAIGGGSATVHFVPGEGIAWDPIVQANKEECDEPFLWVRLVTRFRTENFPEPTVTLTCGGIEVIALEFGVARCVSMAAEVDWTENEAEGYMGLSDSYLLDRTLCTIRAILGTQGYLIGADAIQPTGPDGGGIMWATTVFVGINVNEE